jgi:hypothetical protein
MSLLRDIQEATVDQNTSVATLLRKCKILAARLGNEEFKQWIDNELNGYENIHSVPAYRIVDTDSYGEFLGFGVHMKNVPLPLSHLSRELRDKIRKCYLGQPIRTYEAFIEEEKKENPQEPWPAGTTALLVERVYKDLNCVRAWKLIPRSALVDLVDTIKTRVLNFVLEIEKEVPDAGEAPLHQPPLPQEKVLYIFNTYISGHVQNVATGGSNFEQNATFSSGASDENFQKLLDTIMHVNADAQVISKMTAAVEEMRESCGTNQFAKHYNTFISILADHIQVFGPLVAPYLPFLAKLIA